MSTFADKLDTLRQAEETALAASHRAAHALDREPDLHASVVEPFVKWRDHLPGNPQMVKNLTADFIAEVTERGLGLVLTDDGRLRVVDPGLRDAAADAHAEYAAASGERAKFEEDNREALAAEVERAEAQRLRDALDSGDLATVRDVVNA